MARARNIKPGFFTNDDLVELPFEVRLLFIGLWTIADKEGRLSDRPKKIKMEIFPADSVDCDAGLSLLAASGFIKRYSVKGVAYIKVLNWSKHQNPHIKEAPSQIPDEEEQAPEIPEQAPEIPEQAVLIPSSLIPDSLNHIEAPAATPTGSADCFVLPDWIPQETWKAYCKTRSAKKAKNEPHALRLIVADLEKFRALGHDPVEVLNNSIKSGWAGVFEPKQQARASPQFRSIHEQRAETIAGLTGRNRNERTDERDITGEAVRVA